MDQHLKVLITKFDWNDNRTMPSLSPREGRHFFEREEPKMARGILLVGWEAAR